MRSRKLSIVLVVLATLSALVSHVGWWTRSTLLSEDGFAETLVEAMDDAELRSSISTVIVENVVEGAEPRLVAARPIIEGAVDAVLASDAFATALQVAVKDIHKSVFDEDAPTVTIQVTQISTQVRDLVRTINPELADASGWDTAADLPITTDRFIQDARTVDRTSKWITYSATALTFILAALALWVSDKRRRTLADMGAGLLTISGLTVIISVIAGIEFERLVGGAQVIGSAQPLDATQAKLAGQFFEVVTNSLRTNSYWIGAIGLLLIAGTAARNPDHPPPSLIAPALIARQAIEHRQLKEHPLARSAGLVIAGVALVYWRDAIVPLLIVFAGAWVAFVGVYGILDVAGRYEPDAEERRKMRLLVSPRALWVTTIVILFGFVVLAFIASRDGFSGIAQRDGRCNGHVELCDKRVDEVVFAGTHNSMAAARESNWFSPYHLGGIRTQLNDGIRALLIDTHWGRLGPGGVIFTDATSSPGSTEPAKVDEADGVSQREVERVEAIRRQSSQGGERSQREAFLCHAFCELGATRLDHALTDVSNFLSDNRREVVILFIEDNMSAKDFAAVAERAGLDRFAYDYDAADPWPTLGQLISSNKRLIVFGETQGPPPSWYENGFELVQDTPFTATTVEELTCRANRGPSDADLLLLNHWVQQTPPSRDLAERVNSYDVLMSQVQQCQTVRGKKPNIIAVDFYSDGDLFKVVDELNAG